MAKNSITDTDTIRSIFKILKAQQIPVSVVSGIREYKALVNHVADYSLELVLHTKFEGVGNSVSIDFTLKGEHHHCDVDVVRSTMNSLVVMLPYQIDIWHERRYKRAEVYGRLFMRLNVIREQSEEEMKVSMSMPYRLRQIYEELSRSVPDVKKIMSMVGVELKSISPRFEVKIHKQGEQIPTGAVIAGYYKAPLFVEDTSDHKSFVKVYPNDVAVSFHYFLMEKREKSGWTEEKIRDEIEKLIRYYSAKGVRSFVYVPIVLADSMMGHIYIEIPEDHSRSLNIRDIYFLRGLADIVSEAIAKFKLHTLQESSEYKIPIWDIGMGGVKFEIDHYLAKFLTPGSKIKIFIRIEDREIEATGEVLRIDYEGKKLFAACKFTAISPIDAKFIDNYVGRLLQSQQM